MPEVSHPSLPTASLGEQCLCVESEGGSCRHPGFWRGCWACSAPAQPCSCSAPEDAGGEARPWCRVVAAWPQGLVDSRERLCGATAQPVPCDQGSPPSHQTRHRGGRLTSKTWGFSPKRGPASGSARARAVLQEACQDPARAEGVQCSVLLIFVTVLSCSVCQSYRSGFVRFCSAGLQSALTSAAVGEAEAACARLAALPELPCAHSWGCQRRTSSRESHFIWWE